MAKINGQIFCIFLVEWIIFQVFDIFLSKSKGCVPARPLRALFSSPLLVSKIYRQELLNFYHQRQFSRCISHHLPLNCQLHFHSNYYWHFQHGLHFEASEMSHGKYNELELEMIRCIIWIWFSVFITHMILFWETICFRFNPLHNTSFCICVFKITFEN